MTVIVLAAGQSTRMGENKLLLPLRGRPLILSTVEAASAFTDDVIVVIGHERERMEGVLADCGARIIYCPDYIKGQKYSTMAGIRIFARSFRKICWMSPITAPFILRIAISLRRRFTSSAM